ncbi:MAG: hypothetical protein N3H30_01265, partial [Candidatus Micrarchaeota archaeon]|nr:hypothetical protein [Candidatus Micrarchaeota archaeon]
MQALYKSPVASPQESISKVRLLSKLLIEKEYAKLNMEVKRQYAEWEESITPEALGKTNAT